MKKYRALLKFAIKEQLEYKRNFFISMILMIVNDSLFLLIFAMFTAYFVDLDINIYHFLLIFWFSAVYYGFTHWLFANIARISEIIEQWRLDYFLSFPVNTLKFIAVSKFNIANFSDIIFGVVIMTLFGSMQATSWIFFIYLFPVVLMWTLWMIGIRIMVGSSSFFLDKGSAVAEMMQQFFLLFWSYPPQIFSANRWVFLLVSFLWMYPLYFLPYQLLSVGWSFGEWILFIAINLSLFVGGISFFNYGFKRYKSGNLVVQN